MAKYYKVTRGEAKKIRHLRADLGDYTFRTLMSGGNQRLMRPERLDALASGRGKLKPWEAERLALVSRNAGSIGALIERNEERGPLYSARRKELSSKTKERMRNKALRTWLVRGKEKDIPYNAQGMKTRRSQQKAIHALIFLGYDPTSSEAHFYVRKEAA